MVYNLNVTSKQKMYPLHKQYPELMFANVSETLEDHVDCLTIKNEQESIHRFIEFSMRLLKHVTSSLFNHRSRLTKSFICYSIENTVRLYNLLQKF